MEGKRVRGCSDRCRMALYRRQRAEDLGAIEAALARALDRLRAYRAQTGRG